MDKRSIRRSLCGVLLAALSFGRVDAAAAADTGPDATWESLRQQVALLDRIAYLPSLLPVVMRNSDALGLTNGQVEAFRAWRRDNYERMVDLMNEIIARRIALSQSALDTAVAAGQIVAAQDEIFHLQREVLQIRLSCRNLLIETFTPQQWANLAFVLEDYPQFAGLLAG